MKTIKHPLLAAEPAAASLAKSAVSEVQPVEEFYLVRFRFVTPLGTMNFSINPPPAAEISTRLRPIELSAARPKKTANCYA